MPLVDQRRDYNPPAFSEKDAEHNPFQQLGPWRQEAEDHFHGQPQKSQFAASTIERLAPHPSSFPPA